LENVFPFHPTLYPETMIKYKL